jgi:DNA-binding CsgD family transcriptional regulator
LTDAGRDHPGVASYLLDPQDLSPRRASDAIARVRYRYTGPVGPYQLLGVDHQMSMLVALTPDSGRCWVLLRTGRDFTDGQLAAAADVQSLLTALDRLHPSPQRPAPRRPVLTPLTEREAEVLRHLATGATAIAIGRRLGISPGTVRKHLERVYAKLDCHDRLVAVEKGRAMGVIQALVPPPRPQ